MYKTHTRLTEPEDDTVLWRYMNVTKLLWILETNALFFSVVSELDDPFEGCLTRPTVDRIRRIFPSGAGEQGEIFLRYSSEASRHDCYVSCWHMNPIESAAMWAQYLKSDNGISIRTTFERFRKCFTDESQEVSGGIVKYEDHDTYEVGYHNVLLPVYLKGKSFEHEREFRASIMGSRPRKGVSVAVNVECLIDAVYIAPTSPDWIAKAVQGVLNRYGLDRKVHLSDLLKPPSYLEANSFG